jgi:hypothetical protein
MEKRGDRAVHPAPSSLASPSSRLVISSMSMPPSLSTPPADGPDPRPEGLAIGAGFDFADPDSVLAPLYLRASAVTAVALLTGVFLLINYAPLWHTDIWGHLKFGQWMVQNGRLPERDPFCPFAEGDTGAIHYSWLGQVGLYLLYHAGELLAGGDALERMAGGAALLRFGHALLVVLRCAVLLAAFRRLSGSTALAVVALAFVLGLSIGNVAVLRPQVLGEFFLACVLMALSRPVLSRRALTLVPLLLAVWANTHGSFAAGLVLLAAVAAGRALEALRASGRWSIRGVATDPQLRRLILVLLASVVAVAALNPSGPAIFVETLRMTAHPNVLAQDEWQPLHFRLGEGGQWTYLAILAVLAATRLGSRCRLSPTMVLLILVFAGQPLLRQRMLVWWLMIAPWIMVRYWPAWRARWRGRLASGESVPSFRKTLAAGTLVLLALLWSIPGQWLLAGQPVLLERALSGGTPWRLTYQLAHPASTDARGLPALQKHLAELYPGGRFIGCVFASETLGDLVLWDLAPRTPVFIYTHVHLFTPEHWQRCLAVRSGSPAGRAILDRYRVNLVVVEPDFNPRLCALLRHEGGWKVLVDESGHPDKRDPRQRLFIAVRRQPR